MTGHEVSLSVAVQRANEADLHALTASLDQPLFFANRLARQEEGRGVLLVAWYEGAPVGDVYLRLEPPDEPELLRSMPDVALLTHLEVLPTHRKQGIGSRLMEMAEHTAAREGFSRMALGVTDDNTDAIRLYRERGYQPGDPQRINTYREIYRADGSVETEPDGTCLVFVRHLKASTIPLTQRVGRLWRRCRRWVRAHQRSTAVR
jgi:ribosomal protein S18 acetylase RimI-like enzyme